jgi:hypothetical protein
MKLGHAKALTLLSLLVVFSTARNASPAQTPSPDTVPVSVIVSVEAKHGKEIPPVVREDVRVLKGRDRLQVTDWVPLQGSQSGLELFVLIDEASGTDVASQFDDLRRFMEAQPGTTAIAVGYLEYGEVKITQNFTTDHSAAGKALRIPVPSLGFGNSPYLSIADAIKRWPESSNRRAIFLISDGIDPLQPGVVDSYLDAAIAQAQRTGTQISSIYFSRGGHMGHTFWRINQGQTNLSRLADETGGEGYFQGLGNPVSFAPFLNEFADRISHQYKLTFTIKADKKPQYQHVRLETEVPNAELVTADKVYVPAAK